MSRRLLACVLALVAAGGTAMAAGEPQTQPETGPRFAEIFSDHAVLQRDKPITLWGEAQPGARLTVSVAEQNLVTHADEAGRWLVKAMPLLPGGPYRIKVLDEAGRGTTFSDILVGDVWLCSGQSNMELRTGAAENAWNEVHASANAHLRFVNLERDAEPTRQDRLKAHVQWKTAGPETTGESSAVCYYMAKALQAAEKVPVGFINASWGGTPAEAWIGEPSLRRMRAFDTGLDQLDRHAASPASDPSPAPALPPWEAGTGLAVLYNGMIAPLGPLKIRGVAWYQGEANWKKPEQYNDLLPALIADWRETFSDPDLPFLVVQLPGYGSAADKPVQTAWPQIREAQRRTVLATPGTGLAVIIDLGDRFDIHPAQKAVVGQRLALAARRAAYGEEVAASPEPLRVEQRGRDLVVRFSDTGKGLVTYSANQAIGFETCDAARACRFVEAVPDRNTVVLKDANDPQVRFVRYAWADAPFVNLFNSEDLPVPPFEIQVR